MLPDRGATPQPLLVKLGGSLLDLPDLSDRLRRLADLSPQPIEIVVGGGRAADLIREMQRPHSLPDADAHAVAIDSMDLNGSLVRRLIPGAVREHLQVVPVADSIKSASIELPATWDVTSDSIAAAIASAHDRTLVLAKSIPPPGSIDVAIARGDVDPYFATAVAGRSVGWLNLRTLDPVLVAIG